MIRMVKLAVAATALAGLAACGGGSTGSGALSFQQIGNRADPLITRFENVSSTPIRNVPTSGSANYSGIMAAEADVGGEVTALAGLANMRVGFGSNTLSGSITNIVNDANQRYPGRLNMTNGTIDRSGGNSLFPGEVVMETDVTGRLTGPAGERIVVDGGSVLGFGNPNYEVIGGLIGGDLTVDGTRGSFFGGLVLER
ncbi:hypothetical protein AB3Y40_05565 [Yoonia sp. R2331]|uniref:hypothetical protein n=1 Tax=Yoonia sp. R2331 TaxID=3237238 RepID=UPI0034E5B404